MKHYSTIKHVVLLFFLALVTQFCHAGMAKRNVVTYIQADNNLAPFAGFNVKEMQKAAIPNSVNMLVEWDKPGDNKTWRYQIKYKQLLDAGTINGAFDLGTNPVQELVEMALWAKTSFNAEQWCIILWNHGYGIIDPRLHKLNKTSPGHSPKHHGKQILPWLMLPGLSYGPGKDRGILFDDSQNTYVTASGLRTAVAGMSSVIGQKIGVLCMDACLMGMIEVGYQLKDLVNIFVASQNTEPGNGYHYAGFLAQLSGKPSMTDQELATVIVQQYGLFYTGKDNSITQSAVYVDALIGIKNNINQLVEAVNSCNKANSAATTTAVKKAVVDTMSFEIKDYVDLLSLYNQLNKTFAVKLKATPKGSSSSAKTTAFNSAANNVRSVIAAGIPLIKNAVLAKANGRDYKDACGISIYFPTGSVDPSYADTMFARDTNWDAFIARYS
jgi:hypothetical protein